MIKAIPDLFPGFDMPVLQHRAKGLVGDVLIVWSGVKKDRLHSRKSLTERGEIVTSKVSGCCSPFQPTSMLGQALDVLESFMTSIKRLGTTVGFTMARSKVN